MADPALRTVALVGARVVRVRVRVGCSAATKTNELIAGNRYGKTRHIGFVGVRPSKDDARLSQEEIACDCLRAVLWIPELHHQILSIEVVVHHT